MIARWMLVASAVLSGAAAVGQVPTTEPEPADGWFNWVDASEHVVLEEGISCPGCQTVEDYRNAARTACFSGYREPDYSVFNWWYAGSTPATTPGVVPGPNNTYHVAGAGDPCRYNVELRGNFRSAGAVRVWVCNGTEPCLLVSHQFVPQCPGVGARISNGRLTVSVVSDCMLVATGIEGLCTTVRMENLNEDQHCITTVSNRGKIPPPLPEMPSASSSAPPPNPTIHGNPGHTDWLHTIHCISGGNNGLH